jgi:hypothetical protein
LKWCFRDLFRKKSRVGIVWTRRLEAQPCIHSPSLVLTRPCVATDELMPAYASIMVWCMNQRRCLSKRGWREERLERRAHDTGPGLACSSFELLHCRYAEFLSKLYWLSSWALILENVSSSWRRVYLFPMKGGGTEGNTLVKSCNKIQISFNFHLMNWMPDSVT